MIPQSSAPKGDSSWLFMYGLKPVPFTNRVFPHHLKPDLFSMFTARLCRALIQNRVFPQPVEALDDKPVDVEVDGLLARRGAAGRFAGRLAMAQGGSLVLERDGRTISLEPYAANIVRVTISMDGLRRRLLRDYGFVAKPSAEGWTHERDAEGSDVYRSARMVVRVWRREICLKISCRSQCRWTR